MQSVSRDPFLSPWERNFDADVAAQMAKKVPLTFPLPALARLDTFRLPNPKRAFLVWKRIFNALSAFCVTPGGSAPC